ncbi:SAM-dependent methyltransferase [Micromonospora saelicesensis]|uniref:SAM-dependent methyltransferase n=1 Tax=Micromonospora saelicesensis TaxID=285676 RepID=UPI003D94FEDA
MFSRPIDLHGASPALWSQLRLEVYGVDARQHGWSTRAELDRMVDWLRPHSGSRLLDVGCGEGGPARYLAAESGARVVGVELDLELVQTARREGALPPLGSGVEIVVADARRSLGLQSAAFDAISCVDVVPHLVPLGPVLHDWRRLLAQPESRLLVIDPVVPFGPVSDAELRLRTGGVHYELRASADFSAALQKASLQLLDEIDLTPEMLAVADAWATAVQRERQSLLVLDGEAAVQHQLDFCRLILELGCSRRLRRIAYLVARGHGRA